MFRELKGLPNEEKGQKIDLVADDSKDVKP